jgi:HTH-type transcriptional regulator/antitoxin HigA
MTERIPAEVFPPGEFLADELEARGWPQVEFAAIIRRPVKLVNEIIAGKKAITPETAREFAAALGTSPQYWLNLENAYQLWKTKPSPSETEITREANLRQRFPVRELIKRKWIDSSESFEVLEQRIFSYYGVKSVEEEPQLSHAARKKYDEEVKPLQEAWLFRVKQLATAYRGVPDYSEKALRNVLPQLEAQLREPEDIREALKLLHGCGIRLLVVEPIPGSRIDGVAFWINKDRSPVIGLTLKGDYIDRFWFNLRHEIEHVLNGDGKNDVAVAIDNFDSVNQQDSESEKAANKAAADFCVPQKALDDFIVRHDPLFSTDKFIGFCRIVKRHPGIVAGQLQRKIDRNDLFKKYQPRVRDIVIEAALTDGYGKNAPMDI